MGGLVIVESPNKCQKIRKILGSGYEVMASVGHIMDLDKKMMGIDTDTWTLTYVINPDKQDVVKKLKEAAKHHKNIYIATDQDREGECIAWNIRENLPSKGKNVYRSIFKTITKNDVLAGIQNPVPFDQLAYQAQQTRRATDRLTGFKVSPLLWSKGMKGTSAGRVQSAALKFVIDREREIKSFVQEEYWTITAQTQDGFDVEFYGINGKKVVPKTKKEVEDIIKNIQGDLIVSDYQKKSRIREPSAPFITSTMQKEAGTKFGWSAQRVMDNAQSLFSMGLITYHRTDSTRTEASKLIDLRDLIEQDHGKKYLAPKTIDYAPKDSSQNAHECIRPTYEAEPLTLSTDEQKLLQLIKDKFMSSQMAAAQFDQVSVKLDYVGKDKYEFRTTGQVLQFDGFLKVYGSASKDVILPTMKKGQTIKVKKIIPTQHFTKPPSRYTEPAFTELMEKTGIGRPATYAATIETLVKRKYVVRDGKTLKGTEIGAMVCEYLEKHFDTLTSPQFTAEMENKVDQVAEGKIALAMVMNGFYQELLKTVDLAKKDKSKELFRTDHDCPKCGKGTKMVKKVSELSVFLSCETYPVCGETMNFAEDGKLVSTKTETGLPCPECGNLLIERTSKWGKWLGCSSHPTCAWTGKLGSDGKIVEKKKTELTDIKCDKCNSPMAKRSKGDSAFLGCSKFPKCKNTMNIDEDGNIVVKKVGAKKKTSAKSIGKTCPKCKTNELAERDGKFGIFIACLGFPKCKYIEKEK